MVPIALRATINAPVQGSATDIIQTGNAPVQGGAADIIQTGNAPVQGSAADIVKLAMLQLQLQLKQGEAH